MDFAFRKTLFNLDILVLSKQQIRAMRPVKKLNIFEPSSNNFEPDGLFSVETFGAVGSNERNTLFSYIDLRLDVFHPLVYNHIITARAFYREVMAGKKYAIFDEKLGDLVPAIEDEGRTGFSFFMEVLGEIKWVDNDSDLRKFKIYMISKYGTKDYMLSKFLVLPAGMRDYRVNKNGVPEESEINDIYRKLLTLSNSLSNIKITEDTMGSLDIIRYRIQEATLELYDYIIGLLDGKKKLIQGKFGSRGIMYGTRNVITPSLSKITSLKEKDNLGIDHTTVGLFQYARAVTPITMNRIHTLFISKIFMPDSSSAYLVDKDSLKTVLTEVSVKDKDTWMTLDGLDVLLGTMGQDELRKEPIVIGDYYLMLIHDDGKTITPIFNTDNLPEGYDPKYLRPITYYELLHIALMDTYDKYRCLVTRYPVINVGGIYPSKIYVKTTINPKTRIIKLGMKEVITKEYPNYDESFYNSLSPHYAFLPALGGDHDGDKVSFTVVFNEESIEEIDKLMSSKEFYISPDNRLIFTPETDTLKYTIAALNKGVVYD